MAVIAQEILHGGPPGAAPTGTGPSAVQPRPMVGAYDPEPNPNPIVQANAAEVQKEARLPAPSAWKATVLGFENTTLSKLWTASTRPAFQPDGTSLDLPAIQGMLQSAGVPVTEDRLEVLAGSKSRAEALYHLDVFRKDQENARELFASPLAAMGGSLVDVDTLAAGVLTLGSAGLGSAYARAILGERATALAATSLRYSNYARGAFSENRLKNAAAGAVLFGAVDASGQAADTSHKWDWASSGMSAAFGAFAGILGPLERTRAMPTGTPTRSPLGPVQQVPSTPGPAPASAVTMPEPPDIHLADSTLNPRPAGLGEFSTSLRAAAASAVRGDIPVDMLQKMSVPERVSAGMQRSLDRARGKHIEDDFEFMQAGFGKFDHPTFLDTAGKVLGRDTADALKDLGVQGSGNYRAFVKNVHENIGTGGVRVVGEFQNVDPAVMGRAVQYVQALRDSFAGDARFVLAPTKDAGARGRIFTLDEDTFIIQYNPSRALQKNGIAQFVSSHEFGHAVFRREFSRAVRNGETSVVDAIREAYHAELLRKNEVAGLGVADRTTLLERHESSGGSDVTGTAHDVTGTQGVASEAYYRNFDEWGAQQFVKYGDEILADSTSPNASIRDAARNSAFYKSLPDTFKAIALRVLEVFEKFFTRLKAADLAPHANMREFFNEIASRRGEDFGNPRAFQATVLDDLQDLPEGFKLPTQPGRGESLAAATVDPAVSVPAPPPSPAVVSPNSPALLRWSENVLGKGWYSLHDKGQAFGGRIADLMSQWVVDGAGSTATSAVAHARVAKLELDARLAGFENGIKDELGWGMLDRIMKNRKFRAEYKALMSDVYDDLMQKHRAHLRNEPIPVNPNAKVERLSKLYADTGYAEKALEYLQTAGRTGAADVRKSPWYTPMRTSYDSIADGIRTQRFTEADVKSLLKAQVAAMYPTADAAKVDAIGNGMYRGILERAEGRNSKSQHFEGTTGDELESAMQDAGIAQAEIDEVLGRYQPSANDGSKDRNLRHRLDWDFSVRVGTANGGSIGMKDIVDGNIPRVLEQYGRSVSGQYGFGMVGYKDGQDLRRGINAALADLRERGGSQAELDEAVSMLENTVHSLLGRRVGEETPALLRAVSEISASVVLRNSAVYNLGELSRIAHYAGAARTVQFLFNMGFHNALKGVTNHADLQDLQMILANRHIADGRWRAVVTHTEDNFDMPSGWVEGAHAIGQATRFFNGLEWSRKKLSNTLAQICIADFYQALRGDAKTAARLEKYGFSPELLKRAAAEVQAKGNHPMAWDKFVRADTEAAMHNLMDQINQSNRLGELPAFIQFSTFGKALFPYLSFVGGAFNKVLRKGLADEDTAGAAQLMLWQLGAGAGSEMIRNILAGREPDDSGGQNFVLRSMTNAPMSAWIGYVADTATSPMQSGFAALSFLERVKQAATDPSLSHMAGAIPLLSVTPGVLLLTKSLEE